jgi:cytochrome c556
VIDEPLDPRSLQEMKRLACVGAMTALMGVAAVFTGTAGAGDEKTPTIKEIMGALTKGPKAAFGQTKAALNATPPDWKAAKTAAVAIRTHAPALPKNDPPRGDKADFVKQADAFKANALALADALDKEDLAASKAALGKLNTSCMACHRAHRPQ